MAKANGKLTAQTVGTWFSALQFEEQQKVLSGLQQIHGKVRQVRIDVLKRELAVLENGSANGHAAPKVAKRRPKKSTKGSVRVKYRDPKSGETWSGRGRMARWLADRVNAGEKQDNYLA
jgi:DNA-binding protein H-NS